MELNPDLTGLCGLIQTIPVENWQGQNEDSSSEYYQGEQEYNGNMDSLMIDDSEAYASYCLPNPADLSQIWLDQNQCNTPSNSIQNIANYIQYEVNEKEYFVNRIIPYPSQSFLTFCGNKTTTVTCDGGANFTLIELDEARRLSLKIYPNSKKAKQMDNSAIHNFGICRGTFTRGPVKLIFTAMVVKKIAGTTFLGGMPFLKKK